MQTTDFPTVEYMNMLEWYQKKKKGGSPTGSGAGKCWDRSVVWELGMTEGLEISMSWKLGVSSKKAMDKEVLGF